MLLGTVLVLLLLGGGPASAHAALRSADPADGSVVKTAPGSITLTFTESVGLLDDSFRVFDPDNQRLKTGKSEHADGRADTARITLPGKLGTGTFTVAWRVVSADSHPIAGAFTFSVGEPSAIPPALPSTSVENSATSGLFNIGRYVAYLAAALLIGTAAFVAVCRPPDIRPLRRLLLAGWWALTVSTVFLLLLRGPYETGAGPAEVLDPAGLTRTLGTRPGLALVARLALLAAAAVVLLRQRGLLKERKGEQPSRPVLLTGAALAVGLALTWAAAEHASAGIQVPAAMTSSVLHLLSMAVWLGGLTALLTLLYRASVPGRVVNGFSRLAGWSVTVLVVTGVYQSWRGVGSVSALTDTTYGRVLLAKLAMVTLLLAAGARSRQTVTTATRGARGATETTEAREATEATEATQATERTAGNVAVETADEQKEARVPEPVGGRAAVSAAQSSTGRAEGLVLPEKPSPEKPSAEKPSVEVPAVEKPSAKRSAFTPAEDAHRRALRRSVLAEVAVSVVVLVLTTVLTGTLPGRAAAEAATAEQSAGLPVASVTNIPFEIDTPRVGTVSGKVQVTLDPGRVGDNGLQAVVYGPDGGFVSVPELRLSFSLPDQDIGPIDAKVTDKGGYWGAAAVNLPIPGTWEMKATVRVSDIDQVSETKPVRIER
ncbi:copper resistance CopC/CopD family protein [Streptomyces sp. ME18-1-4]|uniref:copper resistance CopC/CopD family protein n=1 Tax=Streptomyces sp. ME18-1-4 TaxID=3028685 RepID=UPI0029AC7A51|nr:copper resistance protein CopC [Streptomyces sp. ME18-1-4]MDX3244867.1 copper resistance protein CopC [Streptomyces sp. ME18-1-4]